MQAIFSNNFGVFLLNNYGTVILFPPTRYARVESGNPYHYSPYLKRHKRPRLKGIRAFGPHKYKNPDVKL